MVSRHLRSINNGDKVGQFRREKESEGEREREKSNGGESISGRSRREGICMETLNTSLDAGETGANEMRGIPSGFQVQLTIK